MDFTQLFIDSVKGCREFSEAIDIVKKNSYGNIWLAGGFVYRNIASTLHGAQKLNVDFDFIVEHIRVGLILPYKWGEGRINSFGNPKFVSKKLSIDLVPIESIHSITARKLEPTIENYLTGVPLTIQSMAYDFQTDEIIGEIGMNALNERKVAVNNLEGAVYEATRKGMTLNDYIKQKAECLGFIPVYNTEQKV